MAFRPLIPLTRGADEKTLGISSTSLFRLRDNSAYSHENVNKVLTGAESGKDAVVQVEQVARRIVH
jgi:hypothetical protein